MRLRSAVTLDLTYTKEQSQARIRALRPGGHATAELVLVCQVLIEIGAEQDRLAEANHQLFTFRA